nr:MAG TPA: hypothetical protein [Caudoviricetes sp.]
MNTKSLSRDWLYKPFYDLVLTLPCGVKGMEIPTFTCPYIRRVGKD